MGTRRTPSLVTWAREHPTAVDAVLGGVLAAVSLLALVLRARAEHLPPPGPAAVALVLLINLPLAWRRRRPFWANLGVGAAAGVYGATPLPDLVTPVAFGGLVALYSMAAWCEDRRRSVLVGVVSCACFVIIALDPASDSDLLDLSFGGLSLAGAWVFGDSARIRRAYTAELEARATWLAREREFEARRAVAAERARIARELHDVVAHHVSMMVVQAEAGPVVAGGNAPAVTRTFDTIAGIGRQALVEMRRLLGVLREETGGEGPGGGPGSGSGDGSGIGAGGAYGAGSGDGVGGASGAGFEGGAGGARPALAPQPGMAELPELVEQVRRAGLPVLLEVEGDPVRLPPGVGLSAYRIVQEALTNVLKHAGPAQVLVRVRYDERDLRLEVSNGAGDAGAVLGGRSAVEAGAGTGDTTAGQAGPRGHGLAGMRERAQLFGGELTAGPCPGGGFAVTARLPTGGAG
ncbi:two-component sensor histidine kinase [Sphaerisporangium melleum]|uniref:histidine kinase n=1 Tax=Sphaerisporangium melleum TaxID=321316 RepID=A0A917QXX1_9ACTN|nr:histidine kinase [Sphaerisporangium melleum]GGK73967.1 two-component sensor histidine kinase [Sphaerisporangium melleum]GII70857.1 two-component sensor histidine kinase [Sphaerisporangium melleum]